MMNTMALPPPKSNAVDSTNEVPYRDLKHRSIPTACLKQIKPFGSRYGTSVLVLTDSAPTTGQIHHMVRMLGDVGEREVVEFALINQNSE